MFFWIGVLVVSLAIVYISYRLLRLVHLTVRRQGFWDQRLTFEYHDLP